MATKQNLNEFSRLKREANMLHEDINFLRNCLKKKVVPHFVKVTCSVKNSRTKQVIDLAQRKWLRVEIKYLFSKLNEVELKLYSLHLEISKSLNCYESDYWLNFLKKGDVDVCKAVKKKKEIHNKKLLSLVQEKLQTNKVDGAYFEPENIPNLIVNLSDTEFSNEELNLLNKGLKYTPKVNTNESVLLESVIDIETILKYKMNSVQKEIREKTLDALVDAREKMKQRNDLSEAKVLKKLKERDVFYLKAD